VSTALFWFLSLRAEACYARAAAEEEPAGGEGDPEQPPFRLNLFKAAVPFVPISLLFLTTLPEPFWVLRIPREWFIDVAHFEGTAAALQATFDSRLIGAAMLAGVVVAAATDRRQAPRTALVFFEGVGYAFTHILSLIVCASCFGKGVEQIGLAALLGRVLEARPGLLLPAAVGLPLSFALLCGSGMASTQSLFGFFVAPASHLGQDPLRVGAVVSLASAAGRTMSPVAAVTLMCASLAGVHPLALVRRVAGPLLAGMLAVLVAGLLLAALG
jgi:DcuC family C4-dicarboxylate transporter